MITKRWHRWLILCLVVIIALQSSILSFAVTKNEGVNDNGQGNEQLKDTGATAEGMEVAGVKNMLWTNSGIRFTLVDSKGMSVSSSVDIVRAYPWDVGGLSAASSDYGVLWKTWYNQCGIWNKPKNKIVYLGGGKRDNMYTYTEGDLSLDGFSEAPSKGGVHFFQFPTNSEGQAVKSKVTRGDDGRAKVERPTQVSGKMYTVSFIHRQLSDLLTKMGYKAQDGGEILNLVYSHHNTTQNVIGSYKYKDEETGTEIVRSYIKQFPCALELFTDGGNSVNSVGEYLTGLMMYPIGEAKGEDINLIHLFLSLKVPDTTGTGKLKNGDVRIIEFLDDKVKKEVAEKEKEYVDKGKKEYAAYAEALLEIMGKYQYKLQCEPIYWGVPSVTIANFPQIVNNKYGWTYTPDVVVYGTITNIVNYMAEHFIDECVNNEAVLPYIVNNRLATIQDGFISLVFGNGGKTEVVQGTKIEQYAYGSFSDGSTVQKAWLAANYPEYYRDYPGAEVVIYADDFIPFMFNNAGMCEIGWNDIFVSGFTTKNPTFTESESALSPYTGAEFGDKEFGNLFGNSYNSGYSVIYFDVAPTEQEPYTRTWDEDVYSGPNYKPGPPPVPPVDTPDTPQNPDNPGNTPDDPTKPSNPDDPGKDPGTDPGNPDANINIVKFYSSKNGDGTYKYIENHVREKTVRNIQIDDEPGYKVDSWFTSIDYKKPTSSSESYDDTRSSVTPGSLSGDKPTLNIIIYTLTCPLK